ncbi:hypothetical protein [Streptomyces sp. NPDC051219]|uniref:hypothetical protein n=1 Tax=Streptomyces sp. NPDC051219 TaxID=3155283 RepID=UPI003422D755
MTHEDRRLPDLGDSAAPAAPPTDAERALWSSIRKQASGKSHREVKAALEAAKGEAGRTPQTDGGRCARAQIDEWERILETLADHDGPYDPDADPFVQGQLMGQHDREAYEHQHSLLPSAMTSPPDECPRAEQRPG